MKFFVSQHLIDFYLELLSTDRVLNSVGQRIIMNNYNKCFISAYYSNFCKMVL